MRLKIISDITIDPVVRKIKSILTTVEADVFFSENITAEIMQHQPNSYDAVWVCCDSYFKKYSSAEEQEILLATIELGKRSTEKIIIPNTFFNAFPSGSYLDQFGSFNTSYLVQQLLIKEEVRKRFYMLDITRVLLRNGLPSSYNFTLGHLYQMPYTKKFIDGLAEEMTLLLKLMTAPEKKVIIVDCDNTLWGGILGEDGIEGIRCDKNQEGILYFHFQQFLLRKKAEGFLLAICSKNNHNDVKEAFTRKNFPLKWEDFIVHKINWNDKYINIQSLATELNLGLESFIFIDDNEFEATSVQQLLPSISCLHFEGKYTSFLDLTENFLFRKRMVLEEDSTKSDQYKTNALRDSAKAQYASFDEYLKSLEINLNVEINDASSLERASQMTAKTNQFNFNKVPYSQEELSSFIEKGGLIYTLRVKDKYGDYGIVGLIILLPDGKQTYFLENYLMSCRALGKRIEDDFFSFVLQDLENRSAKLSTIHFKHTEKNEPAATFYSQIKANT